MRIEPRKQILDIWRDMLKDCYEGKKWTWGGRAKSNPIADAEQLLCLFYPITQIDTFGVYDPDAIPDDVLEVLRPLGESSRISRTLVDVALEYFDNHTAEDGQPRFGAGSYLGTLDPNQAPPTDQRVQELEVVDAYSMSITLCLSLLVFVNARAEEEKQARQLDKLGDLRVRASRRLTAAMIGMLRSFVVNSVSVDTAEGQNILNMLRQGDTTDAELQQGLSTRFGRLRSQLHADVRLGVPDETKPDDDQLFECGWTWGIAQGAEPIDGFDFTLAAKEGYATTRPWLYFTVSALDGIVDLNSRRIRALNILDEDQRRLSDALALRWDLTQRYWSAVARFDPERWPLEDIPWRTSDGEESDYYSLLVMSVLIQDLINRAATDADLIKAVGIIQELATRGRITRRMIDNDPAVALHHPGVRQGLGGSEDLVGTRLALYTTDYAPLIIKRSLQAAQLTDNIEAREALLSVAEAAMDHLNERRLIRDNNPVELWDSLHHFPGLENISFDSPSWYLTERVVEALVATATAFEQEPPRSSRMYDHLLRLLHEADHVYNQELLRSNVNDRTNLRDRLQEIGEHIKRSRELRFRRTSTAIALAERALRLLDALEEAREDAGRSQ
ncbi:SCO2524 family protein [Catenulispora pinisilvae]|uniref:SCO2524 family protein n=1 Tax=Catenulispora pinisilvae TaxID=2705253 RepID=UPI002B267516|nr:SCO2524 family protein [Catenulispora pinisilvae]